MHNKTFKIIILSFLISLLTSCQSVENPFSGKKRSDGNDEFFVDKKGPLSLPPDFDKLPMPKDEILEKENEENNEEDNINKLLKIKKTEDDISKSNSTTEESILEKIKNR
tara:strand:- start:73 stop:402 length:330 start_codon:yes stop_codon:yes gene_type:complete